jgi:hypothetical protein
VIAATTITGDSSCRSTNVDYRLDTPSARSFLANFVSLPEPGPLGVTGQRRARGARTARLGLTPRREPL